MSKPLFSVIIPAYNYAHTLERAISSVFSQQTNDYELIIINDGSTDHTEDLIKNLKKKTDKTVHYFPQRNSGPASARNKGITESKGKYLIFLDADDELTENALNSLRKRIQADKSVDVIIGAHISVQPDGTEKFRSRPKLPDSIKKTIKMYLLDEALPISNGATAMHRKVFNKYRFPEQFRCVEDIPVFVYALSNFHCVTTNKPIAKIHKHIDSLRHDISLELSVGMALVDEIFSPDRIPVEFLSFRDRYETLRYLGIFRTLYIAGDHTQALSYYKKAVIKSPSALFHISFLKKAIRAAVYARKKNNSSA